MKVKISVSYLIMCMIWGSTWLAIKIGLEDLPPILFAGVRFLIATLFLGVILKFQKFPLKLKMGEFKVMLFMGIFMIAVPYSLVFWGEQYTNSAMGAVLMCAMPLFVFPVSYIMKSDEKLSFLKLVGVTIGLAGVFVIFYPKLLEGVSDFKGDVAILASVVIYAVATVYLKKYAAHIPVRKSVFYQLLFATPLLLIAGILFESPRVFFTGLGDWKAVAALFYLAIFGSVLTFLIYFWLIVRIGAVASASAIFLEVGLAVLLDWFVMSVVPHHYTWIGLALLFAGVWIVVVRGGRKGAGLFEECGEV